MVVTVDHSLPHIEYGYSTSTLIGASKPFSETVDGLQELRFRLHGNSNENPSADFGAARVYICVVEIHAAFQCMSERTILYRSDDRCVG